VSVDLSDVPKWLYTRGVGHAVAYVNQLSPLSITTLCGMIGNFPRGCVQIVVPDRICTKCREVLRSGAVRLTTQPERDTLLAEAFAAPADAGEGER
jgi:hypothetical protein